MDDFKEKDWDAKLETVLRRRATPMAPAGLSERIIAAALEQKRAGRFDIREFWKIISEELLLPHPAYVLAGVLLVGVTVGFNAEIQSFFTDNDTQAVSAYKAVDAAMEDGALL